MTNRELIISEVNYKLSKYTGNYDIEAINRDIKKLNNMNDDDATDYLLGKVITNLKQDHLTAQHGQEILSYLLRINNKYKNSMELGKHAAYLDTMNLIGAQDKLEVNHEKVKKTLLEILPILNDNNVDYYLHGGVCCYLNTNQEFQRYHNNIDIFINEEDLLKLNNALKGSEFSLEDERLLTNAKLYASERKLVGRHNHGVYINSDDMLNIGLFLFRREEDNSITRISYYRDQNDQIKVFLEPTTIEQTKLMYTTKKENYYGIPYRSASLENMYLIKKDMEMKDKYDAEYIKPYLNKTKLKDLIRANENSLSAYTEEPKTALSIVVRQKELVK